MNYSTKYFKKISIFFCLTAIIFVINCSAQTKQTENIHNDSCENNKVMFWGISHLINELESSDKSEFIKLHSPVIVIARLGAREKSNIYNFRRLNIIRKVYFLRNYTGVTAPVFAQGEKLKEGSGRVEIYYGGIMQFAIMADYNHNLKDCYSDPRWAEG